jgi:succinate dehydrogenase / fumarate reductase membrane anchor subunit
MPYPDPNRIQTPTARAKGAGPAHGGTHHWWMIKVTSVVLIPLTLWFFFSLLHIIGVGGTYDTALNWIKLPYNAFLLVLFLGVNFWHAAIAGQEIIVDYVPSHHVQLPAIMLYKFFCYGFAALSIFSVLYISFRM